MYWIGRVLIWGLIIFVIGWLLTFFISPWRNLADTASDFIAKPFKALAQATQANAATTTDPVRVAENAQRNEAEALQIMRTARDQRILASALKSAADAQLKVRRREFIPGDRFHIAVFSRVTNAAVAAEIHYSEDGEDQPVLNIPAGRSLYVDAIRFVKYEFRATSGSNTSATVQRIFTSGTDRFDLWLP